MNTNRVCPVERAGGLDNTMRRLLQNPAKILAPYLKDGMTALDFGCGPGFFTIEMAQRVGDSGCVIAADIQAGMLQIVGKKIQGTNLEKRVRLHQCAANRLGISAEVDFILMFYMVHEVPHKQALFAEIARILKPGGQVLIVEPPFHVSKYAFRGMIRMASLAGLDSVQGPHLLFNKTVILTKPV